MVQRDTEESRGRKDSWEIREDVQGLAPCPCSWKSKPGTKQTMTISVLPSQSLKCCHGAGGKLLFFLVLCLSTV